MLQAAIAVAALWTLCSHAVVASGASLRELVQRFAARSGDRARGGDRGPESRVRRALAAAADRVGRAGGGHRAAAAQRRRRAARRGRIGAAFALALHRSPVLLWWSILGVLALAALLFALREAPVAAAAPLGGARGSSRSALLAVALLPRSTRWSSTVPTPTTPSTSTSPSPPSTHPERRCSRATPCTDRFDLPLHLPIYRLHSYELALGALSLADAARRRSRSSISSRRRSPRSASRSRTPRSSAC